MKTAKEWKADKDLSPLKARRQRIVDAINKSIRLSKWSYKVTSADFTQNDWNSTLMTAINFANKDFGGTTIIASSEVNAIISGMILFEPIRTDTISMGADFYISGTLASKFTVFVDPYLPAPILLVVKDDFFTADNPDCAVIKVDDIPTFYDFNG